MMAVGTTIMVEVTYDHPLRFGHQIFLIYLTRLKFIINILTQTYYIKIYHAGIKMGYLISTYVRLLEILNRKIFISYCINIFYGTILEYKQCLHNCVLVRIYKS